MPRRCDRTDPLGHVLRRLLVGLAVVATSAPAQGSALRVRVVTAEDIFASAGAAIDGGVAFRSEGGHRLTLQLDPEPEEILNPTYEGRLHPIPASMVESALAEMRRLPGAPLDIVVYCLPGWPEEVRASHCVGREVFLTPTFAPPSDEVLAYTVVHELGHAIEHLRMGEATGPAWETYLRLRDLGPSRHHATAVHRDRPAEIFAEDFRMLYGGPVATYSGTHENPDLPHPVSVAGLASFMDGLLSGAYADGRPRARVSNHPNPFNPRTTVVVRLRPEQAALGGTALVEVHDLRGRRVRLLAPRPVAEEIRFEWDGLDHAGSRVASGRYLYRVRLRDEVVAGSMTLLE